MKTVAGTSVKMRAALGSALNQPVFRPRSCLSGGVAGLDAKLQQDRAKWAEVIKVNHITIGD